MTLYIKLPIIKSKGDLDDALARLDVIFHAPAGTLEAHERGALIDLIAAYEKRNPKD